jgi:hypothetical protein
MKIELRNGFRAKSNMTIQRQKKQKIQKQENLMMLKYLGKKKKEVKGLLMNF